MAALTGCAQKAPTPSRHVGPAIAPLPKNASIFRVRYQQDLNNFDWGLATDPINAWVLKNEMEGLFEIADSGQLEPRLAAAYTVSSDRRDYTFTIRDNVYWSDGVPLKADDFYFSWKRLLDPATGSANADVLFDVEGAKAFHKGQIKDFEKVGIKVEDEHTIRIHLGRDATFFLQMLTMWPSYPLRKDIVEKYGADWVKPGNVVVVGPFITSSIEKGKQTVLRRNENYYGPRPVIDAIEMNVVRDDAESIARFKKGKFDQLWVAAPKRAERELKGTHAQYRSEWVPWTAMLMFNADQKPLGDRGFRQALAMAIDRAKLSGVLGEKIVSASSLVTPEVLPQGKGTSFEFEPAKARAILKKAGVDAGKLPPIELTGVDTELHRMIMGVIKDELKRNLGLKIVLKPTDRESYDHALSQGGARQMFFDVQRADFLDPHAFLRAYSSGSSKNLMHWSNAEFDRILVHAAGLTNSEERSLLYRKALLELQHSDVRIIPIFHRRVNYFLSSRVKRFKRTPLGDVYFRDVTFF